MKTACFGLPDMSVGGGSADTSVRPKRKLHNFEQHSIEIWYFLFRLYVAFGSAVCSAVAKVDTALLNRRATRVSALPTAAKLRWGPQVGSTPRSQWSIPPLLRSSMCSEWGLLALARRTYSSKCPLDISRCGLIASSTAAKLRRGPQVGSTPRSASRSAIGSQGLTTPSSSRRPMPPLSPKPHFELLGSPWG